MKSLKNLLIPAVAVVLLIIGSIVYFALNKGEDVPAEEMSEVTILNIDNMLIDSFQIDKKSGESLFFKQTFDEVGPSGWIFIDDDPSNDELSLSSNSIDSYVSILSYFISRSVVNNPTSLDEYGLNDPDYTITITSTSGEISKLYVGNLTYDGQSCYCMIEGDDNVYTCVAIKRNYCANTLIDFLSAQILDVDVPNIASVRFNRTTDGTDFTASCSIVDGYAQFTATEPYQIKCSSYFTSLIEKIADVQISSFLELEDSQLAEYGLDNPAFNFTFTLKTGEVIELSLSQNLAGTYYGKCSAIEDKYFAINQFQLEGLETPILTLLDSYVNYHYINELSSISGSYDGQEFTLDINVDEKITDSTAEVYLNMRNAYITNSQGKRAYASILIESLVCIDIGGVEVDANPVYEPIMTLTYVTTDYKTKVIDFVPRDTDSYYVFIDGEYSCFYVYGKELFNNGGTDTFSYGVWPAYELCETAIDNNIGGVYDIPES